MRTGRHAGLALLLALALVGGTSAPALSRVGPTPLIDARLISVECNPNGVPGLSATAAASVTGGGIGRAELFVGEYQPVSDPAFAPFPWTGCTLANWVSADSWRTGVAADSRTLNTLDPTTWNTRNHAVDLWARSASNSWWIVAYWVTPTGRGTEVEARWYVSCPGGTHVDGATLREITYVDEAGER